MVTQGTLSTTRLAGPVDYSPPVTFAGLGANYPYTGEFLVVGENSSLRLVADNDVDVHIDIDSDGERVFSEGLHDGQAWQWSPDGGVTPQDEKSAAALRHGIELPGRFFTLEDLAESGVKVNIEGEAQENGQRQWQVRVTLADGFSRDYYIDAESALIVRERDHRALHPAVSATEVTVETRKEEAAWLNGVLYYRIAMIINADSGEWLATTRVRSLEHNIEIPEGYFQQE